MNAAAVRDRVTRLAGELAWRLRRPRLTVVVERSCANATVSRGGVPVWTAQVPIDGPDDLCAALGALAAEPSLPRIGRGATVELSRSIVQVRVLRDLPPVSAVALEQLVSHQSRRFFRRNGHPLVTAARWRRGSTPPTALLAAVEEPWLDAVTRGAAAAGLDRVRVRASVSDGEVVPIVAAAEAERFERAARRAIGWTAGAAVLLWVCAASIYLGRLAARRAELSEELRSLQGPAAAIAAARRELGEATGMIGAVESSDRARGGLLASVGRIAAVLPDSAYLSSITLGSAGGVITGVAPDPAAVLAALDRAGVVTSPILERAGTRQFGAGRREQFTIRFSGTSP